MARLTPDQQETAGLVQFIMSKGILDENDVYSWLLKAARLAGGETNEEKRAILNSCIRTMNDNLEPYSFTIRSKQDFISGMNKIAFVNTKKDSLSKSMTTFSQVELNFLKALFESIIDSESKLLTMIDALNLQREFKSKMSKSEAQDLLIRAISGEWLTEVTTDDLVNVTIGTRTFIELEDYIMSLAQDQQVEKCVICKEVVIYGTVIDEGTYEGQWCHYACKVRYLNATAAQRTPKSSSSRAGSSTTTPSPGTKRSSRKRARH